MVGLSRKWSGPKTKKACLGPNDERHFMKMYYYLSLLLALTIASSIGRADCREVYFQKFTQLGGEAAIGVGVAGLATIIGGAGSLSSPASYLTTAAGAATGGGLTTIGEKRKADLIKVIGILDQANVVTGLDLNEFAREINFNIEVTAAKIVELNINGSLCREPMGVLSRSELTDLIRTSLQKK